MKEIYTALLQFQKNAPQIVRDTQGYGYKYPKLEQVIEMVRPVLNQAGLIVWQSCDLKDGRMVINTTIAHAASGQSITSSTPIRENVELKGMNDFQVDGSAISYYRRYALLAMLFLAAEDEDAQGEQINRNNQTRYYEPSQNKEQKVVYAIEGLDIDDIEKSKQALLAYAKMIHSQKIIDDERLAKIETFINNAGWPADIERANIALGKIYAIRSK